MEDPGSHRFDEWGTVPPTALIFVEGVSDRIAVSTMAARLGVDLSTTEIVSTNGSSAFKKIMTDAIENAGRDVLLTGFCDEAETADLVEAITAVGLGTAEIDRDLAAAGFYICRRDLEDELIRAVGPAEVVGLIIDQGDGPSLERLRRQPAWRHEPLPEQLRRFMSSQSGRKARYARLLSTRVDPDRAPEPIVGVLSRIASEGADRRADRPADHGPPSEPPD